MFQRKSHALATTTVRTALPAARPAPSFQPVVRARQAEPQFAPAAERPVQGRTLAVGRGITLSGDIAACETLVVEGSIESTRFDGRVLEIVEGGTFKGSAQVDSARIAGRFEGDLIARSGLVLAATARVGGRIQYGVLEIAAGGEISGEISLTTPPAQ